MGRTKQVPKKTGESPAPRPPVGGKSIDAVAYAQLQKVQRQFETYVAHGQPQKRPRAPASSPLASKIAKPDAARKRAPAGLRAIREIKQYQRTTELLMKRQPFARLVKEIIQNMGKEYRIQKGALEALQEAAEAHIVQYHADANLLAIHSNRVTLMKKDMDLLKVLRTK